MKKKNYFLIILIVIMIVVSLSIPSVLEVSYTLDPEDRTEAFYNAKYILQGVCFLVNVVFVNIALLIYFFKTKNK